MIQLTGIHKHYQQGGNRIRALDGIDLSIAAGEYVAVMGPSGSGKSTLLNVLGALDVPDAGSYTLDGEEVGRLGDDAASDLRNRRIGFVFQSFHLLPRLTVLENVLLPLRFHREPPQDADTHARELLRQVGLQERMGHRPAELSGGQQQRAAIARALVLRPAILLADEPTGNLDSKSAADVLRLIDEVHANGQTVVLVTHDNDIAAHAPRQIRLRDGRIEHDIHQHAAH